MAFSHEAIEDMNTQTAYAKVEAETPVAKDSAAYDKQRDRKKNAAKASEANATLAGFIRLAVLDDPSAQQTVMGAIGMAGKDGVLALQALWASYGPKGRLPFTQQAFDQYVHTASESIGKFIATMDTFFTWHELGGMKLSARRKCEMALQKVHANYRLTMLSTCSAYAYKWVQVKAEFIQLHNLNELLGTGTNKTHAHAHAASAPTGTCIHCNRKHPSDSCIKEPGISPEEKTRRWDAWAAHRKKLGLWFEKVRTPMARLASLEAYTQKFGTIDSQSHTDESGAQAEPFAASATRGSESDTASQAQPELFNATTTTERVVTFANDFDDTGSGADDEFGEAEISARTAEQPTIGAYAATVDERKGPTPHFSAGGQCLQDRSAPCLVPDGYISPGSGPDDSDFPLPVPCNDSESESDTGTPVQAVYTEAPNLRRRRVQTWQTYRAQRRAGKAEKARARALARGNVPQHNAWSCFVKSVLVLAAIATAGSLLVVAADAVLPNAVSASPAQPFVHAAWSGTPVHNMPDYVSEPRTHVPMHAHAATTRSRAKKRARAHVGSTLDLCPDSGASHHFFNDQIYFKSMRRITNAQTVHTASGKAKLEGIGEVDLWLTRSDGRPVVVTIEAYYAPSFVKPLLSVSQLVRDGHSVHFRPQGCGMHVRTDGTRGGAWIPIMCRGGNYSFNAPAALAVSTRRARAQTSVQDGSRVYAKPRGRAPRGKTWCKATGTWVPKQRNRVERTRQSQPQPQPQLQPQPQPQPQPPQQAEPQPHGRTDGGAAAEERTDNAEERTGGGAVAEERTGAGGVNSAQSKRTDDIAWWHSCLGHINSTDCNTAIKRGRITGVPSSAIGDMHARCKSCAAAKSVKAARSREGLVPASAAYDTADIDICEVEEQDHSGNKYVLTITDRNTKYRWSHLLKSHKDAPAALRSFHQWLVSTGYRTRGSVMQLHGDGEFMKGEFLDTAKDIGMKVTSSPPYCQWGNGLAERTFRTLMSGTRVLLNHARLPSTFWGLAYMHFTDIRNMVGNADSKHVSPHEALHGRVPDASRLLPFGHIVAAHVDKQHRTKLEPTSRFGLYVGRAHGYTSSSIRVYMPDTQRVIVTAEYTVMQYKDDGMTTMNRWRMFTNGAANSYPPLQDSHTNVEGDGVVGDVRVPTAATQTIRAKDGSEGVIIGTVQRGGKAFVNVKYTDGEVHEYERDALDIEHADVEDSWCETPRDGMSAKEIATEMFNVNPVLYAEFLKDYEWKDRHDRPFTCRGLRTRFVAGSRMPDPRNHPRFTELQAEANSISDSSADAEVTAFKAMLNPVRQPTFDEAMAGPDREKWIAAMKEHAQSLHELHTFGTPMAKGTCPKVPIKGRWVLVIKDDGRYKARWVTQGFRQKEGIDFNVNRCHADVARMASIRTLIALAAVQGAKISALDIRDFYVTTDIDTEMYVQLPNIPGHVHPNGDHARLLRCLFGMRQSGRLAADKLDTAMLKMGFTQLKTDPCLYTRKGINVAVFVDDLLIATDCAETRASFIREFKTHFAIRDYPDVDSYLGMSVHQDASGISLSMPGYVSKLLEATGMSDCNSQSTPAEKGLRLSREDEAAPAEYQLNGQTYRTVCGSLLWCCLACRPDCAAIVSMLCRHVARPTKKSWEAAKRVIRYLKGTADRGIKYSRYGHLSAYSDASWGDGDSARSTTGYCILLGGAAIDWKSRLQSTVAQSTCEAECLALAECVTEVTYVRSLLDELGIDISKPTPVHVDNKGAVDDSHNKSGRRTRHVNIKFHAVREAVRHGEVKVVKVRGGVSADTEQIADVFTKATSRVVHDTLIPRIMGLPSRDPKVAGADRSPPAGDPAASPTRARTATATVGGTNATARGSILRAPIGRISRRNC